MSNINENHIRELLKFQSRHEVIRDLYNRKRNPDKTMKREMADIRYTCQKYIELNGLFKYLQHGGSTPQHRAEFIDFESISDFKVLIDGIVENLKFN